MTMTDTMIAIQTDKDSSGCRSTNRSAATGWSATVNHWHGSIVFIDSCCLIISQLIEKWLAGLYSEGPEALVAEFVKHSRVAGGEVAARL